MKGSSTALFFCALLCTSFAHDWLSGQEVARQARFRRAAPKALTKASGIQTRTLPSDKPISVCYNPTNGYIAICNAANNMCIIMSPSENICCVFPGDGTACCFNLNLNTGCYITSGCWDASTVTIDVYLGVVSLVALLGIGVNFNVSSTPTIAVNMCATVLAAISVDIAVEIDINPSSCVSLLINISIQICGLLSGGLAPLLVFLTAGVIIPCYGDLGWFLAHLVALANLFLSGTVTLVALISLGLVLDLAALWGCSNGVAALTLVFVALGLVVDIAIYLGVNISSVTFILALIVGLGGDLGYGITGCIKVLLNIIYCKNAAISLEACIQVIITFAAFASVAVDVHSQFSSLITFCNDQNTMWGNGVSLTVCLALFTNIFIGVGLVIDGINLSVIITLCEAGIVNGALVLVIQILILLTVIATNVICISTLVLVLLKLCNDTRGCLLIAVLIPGIVITVNVYGGNILTQLIGGLVTRVACFLLPILQLLNSFTLMSSIVSACTTAVTTATGGALSLSACLNHLTCLPICNQMRTYISLNL